MVASSFTPRPFSSSINDHIQDCIDHYAFEDALFLAQIYYEKEKSEEALVMVSDCQYRMRRFDELYCSLKDHSLSNPRLRFIFASCCFELQKYEECEGGLTAGYFASRSLHPSLVNSSVAPFAYNLLSKIASTGGREVDACDAALKAVELNPLHWSSIQEYINLGGRNVKELFQNPMRNCILPTTCDSDKEQMKDSEEIGHSKTRQGTIRKYTNNCENASRRIHKARIQSRSPRRIIEKQPLASRNSNTQRGSSTKRTNVRIEGREKRCASTAGVLNVLASLSDIQEALSLFDFPLVTRLLEGLPSPLSQLSHVTVLRARLLSEQGDYGGARQLLTALRSSFPHKVDGMEVLSTALWHEQDTHGLSSLARALTVEAKARPETWCAAANCFSLCKQHDSAVRCLERAIRIDSRFSYSYTLLGCELLELEEVERASRAFRSALAVRPNDYRAWYGLSMVHQKKEQLALAQVNLQRALDINGQNGVLLCSMANLQQSLGRCDLAVETLDKALALHPTSIACLYHRARLLYDLRRYGECLDALNQLKMRAPDEANVFFLLGRVHKRLGENHLALLHFNWASSMDPRGEHLLSDLGEPLEEDG